MNGLGRLTKATSAAALLILVLVPGARAQELPRLNEVKVPLREYLELVASVERAEKERAERAANRIEPLAEVVSQSTRVTFGEATVSVKAAFEVLVEGRPKSTVNLPANFVARSAEVMPAVRTGEAPKGPVPAALSAFKNQLFLVAAEPGRYAVRLEGDARPVQEAGVSRYALAPIAAPVAVAEVDLPADLAWSSSNAVVVEERVDGARRHVRLSARRGMTPTVEVRRKLEAGDAERLLAQAVVLTLFQLGPDGAQRHDVILYDVARGSLPSFTVDLPPGLEVDKAGTEEGDVVAVAEARRLTIHRRSQLQKAGYLVLTSTPDAAADLTLAPILPEVEVRARYLAVAATVAAEARPEPEAEWARVDLTDLPASFREALSALDPTAAWRFAGEDPGGAGGGGAAAKLRVARVQPAGQLAAVVRSRETTTVVTVDGTVLHRDRFVLHPVAGLTAALDLTLPPGGILWSAKVDFQPVRPLEKDGVITIPLGFSEGKGPVVEVVSVLEKGVPKGRADWALDLPRLAAPVQDHRWRLLLPANARYRYRKGELRPVPIAAAAPPSGRGSGRLGAPQPAAPSVEGGVVGGVAGGTPAPEQTLPDARKIKSGSTAKPAELEAIPTTRDPWALLESTPGVLTDRINVGGNESGQVAYYVSAEALHDLKKEVGDLQTGLVGGVRSLPVTIPESGKLFVMAGLLPPQQVSVQLEVKGGR